MFEILCCAYVSSFIAIVRVLAFTDHLCWISVWFMFWRVFSDGKDSCIFFLLCTALKNHGGEIGYHNSNCSPSRVYHLRGDCVFAFDLCVGLFEE